MKLKTCLPLFIAFILLGIIGCSSPDSQSSPQQIDVDIPKEQAAIKATLTKMWAAIEEENIEAYAQYVHPDFTQFGETATSLQIGKEAEVQGVKDWVKDASDIHTEMEEPIVTVKGEVAWITYYWKDHGYTQGEEFSSRGKSTRIFVKEEGQWLCIHGHYTLLP